MSARPPAERSLRCPKDVMIFLCGLRPFHTEEHGARGREMPERTNPALGGRLSRPSTSASAELASLKVRVLRKRTMLWGMWW